MAVSASNTVLQFTDVDDALQTLQCDLTDVQYGGPRSVTKTETFCAVDKSIGNPDITIQVTGLYSGEADHVHDIFWNLWYDTTARLYKYGPGGSANGAVLLSGLSFLTDYSIKATAGGDISVDATFEVQGNDYLSTW